MEWQKDSEIFSDIDDNGKLLRNEYTAEKPNGCAADEIKWQENFTSVIVKNENVKSKLTGDEAFEAFKQAVSSIEKYVKSHDTITAFPSPEMNVSAKLYETYHTMEKGPGYNERLARELSDIERERENRKSEISEIATAPDPSVTYSPEVQNAWNKANEAIDKRADYERKKAVVEAKFLGESTITQKTMMEHTDLADSSFEKFTFFEGMERWWGRVTKITDVDAELKSDHVARSALLGRIALWVLEFSALLLLYSLGEKEKFPIVSDVSAKLTALLPVPTAYIILQIFACIVFLAIAFTGMGACSNIVGIPMPLCGFALYFLYSVPVLQHIAARSKEQEELLRNVSNISFWATAIIFALILMIRLTFAGALTAIVIMVCVTFGINWLQMVILSVFFHISLEYIQLIEIMGAIYILVDLFFMAFFLRTRGSYEKQMFDEVEENALTEYKVVRFIRLWINNSDIENKEKYLALADKETARIKESVAQAAAYAEKTKRRLRLK